MPGVAGIIGRRSPDEAGAVLKAMVGCMMHETFYSSGTCSHELLNLRAGWVCHQGTFADCMPVWNEQRDICLVFSGEIYADRVELDRLKAAGHEFDPENASCLVHLYEELGIKFLEKLNGWFSGVLVDLREQRVVLFNDRYGLGRIYFHENDNGFYFSSEAKSLLKVLPGLRQLDARGLGEFFSCGCVLQNRTLFSGISLLPPGSAWVFAPGEPVRKQSYFRPETWESQPALAAAEYYEKLKETWRRVLPRYFHGSERAALSLTGGVDSRMILAWAGSASGELPCFTFGGRYRECMDVKVARQVAKICGQPHEIIPVNGEFLSEFPSLAEKAVYISDGALDVTGAIDLYVQRKAREIAPVRVTGTNGGEMLRRLIAFKPARPGQDQEFLQPDLTRSLEQAATTYTGELKGHKLSFTAFKQAPWHMGSKFVVERSQVTLRMPYFDNDLVALSYQAPPELAESNEPALRLIADGNPALQTIGTDQGLAVRSIPGVRTARHLFQQFTFRAEYAYDYGMPQWLARIDHLSSALHLERLFLGRHKFHHFRLWYRDELSPFVRDVLLDSRSLGRPYLNGGRVADLVNGHLRGDRNYTSEIHKLLTVELAQRQFIEQN